MKTRKFFYAAGPWVGAINIVLCALVFYRCFIQKPVPVCAPPVASEEHPFYQVVVFTHNATLSGVKVDANFAPIEWRNMVIPGSEKGQAIADLGTVDFSKGKLIVNVTRGGNRLWFFLSRPLFSDPTYHGSAYQSAPRVWGRLYVDKADRLWLRLQPTYEGGGEHLDIPAEVNK